VPKKLTLTTSRLVQPTSFDITCPCDDPGDCPWPVTVSVPELDPGSSDIEPPFDARLGTYERVTPFSSVTVTIRKRN
jgi:hypothetical protein